MSQRKRQTHSEEVANVITHGAGMLFGLVGIALLLTRGIGLGDPWVIFSFSVYVLCMLSSYITSTFYHASRKAKEKISLRRYDHAAIYLHIAGTYTPFTLVTLRNEHIWGWLLFTIIWLSAIIGIWLTFRKMKRDSKLKTICYLLMGWVVIIAFKPLMDVLQRTDNMIVLYWLIAGGLCYTAGTIFYSMGRYKYMHSVWHCFTLGGSVCHFVAVYNVV